MTISWSPGGEEEPWLQPLKREMKGRKATQARHNCSQVSCKQAREEKPELQQKQLKRETKSSALAEFIQEDLFSLGWKGQSGCPGPKHVFLFELIKLLEVTAVFAWNITQNALWCVPAAPMSSISSGVLSVLSTHAAAGRRRAWNTVLRLCCPLFVHTPASFTEQLWWL